VSRSGYFSVSAKYNLLLLGGPNENSFFQQYLDRTAVMHTQRKFSRGSLFLIFLKRDASV